MVWGICLPSGFGAFWPDGDFEGVDKNGKDLWGERLRLHYLAQTAEEQRRLYDYGSNHGSYGYYVSGKFITEPGMRQGPDQPPATPVEPHEAPRSFVTVKSYKTLGSFIELNDRIVAVDTALKTIIERLEPGMHGFFPIEICMPRGEVFPKRYYSLVIGQYFDAFVPEKSREDAWGDYGPEHPGIYSYEDSKRSISGLALSKAIFGTAHLWWERSVTGRLFCLSNELQNQIANASLEIPKHYRMMEV